MKKKGKRGEKGMAWESKQEKTCQGNVCSYETNEPMKEAWWCKDIEESNTRQILETKKDEDGIPKQKITEETTRRGHAWLNNWLEKFDATREQQQKQSLNNWQVMMKRLKRKGIFDPVCVSLIEGSKSRLQEQARRVSLLMSQRRKNRSSRDTFPATPGNTLPSLGHRFDCLHICCVLKLQFEGHSCLWGSLCIHEKLLSTSLLTKGSPRLVSR